VMTVRRRKHLLFISLDHHIEREKMIYFLRYTDIRYSCDKFLDEAALAP